MSGAKYEYQTVGRRSTVFSTKGIVSCSQPLASEAGLSILKKGGNAVDAAVAMAAALNVTEPCNCGIGGDVFALYWDASARRVRAINGSGKSPAALNIAAVRSAGIKGMKIPNESVHGYTVSGAAAAWCDMIREWGSGNVDLAEVLQPAITLAEEGFPVHPQSSYEWTSNIHQLLHASSKHPEEYPFLIDGQAPRPGEIFTNPDLAQTLSTLAKEGKDGFYKGPIAQAIVDVCKEWGGLLELSDLAAHESDFVEPISYTFGKDKHTVWECPPNGSGLAALIALGIVDALRESGTDLESMEEGGAEWMHLLIEAMRLAFADAHAFVADPKFANVPVETLLSKPYLKARAEQFNPSAATAQYKQGRPAPSSDTVYFTAADADGNAISIIMSNYLGFGTAIVPRGCGFTLQSRGGGFTLEEGHPNQLEGGKRPFHTIIPAMVTHQDQLYMSFGVMGGVMQPQGHLQVLVNLLHHLHNPQHALDSPRFCIGSLTSAAEGQQPFYNREIAIEDGVRDDVVEKLRKMGHDLQVVKGGERVVFGKGQIIMRLTDQRTGKRVWAAGSDPRGDGCAMAHS